MPATIRNLRSMSGLGILADRDGRPPHVTFRRYNLIYGFNGSGKSTISRMLASLQRGTRHLSLSET
jgi:wobble nucleotide-excising tRNase